MSKSVHCQTCLQDLQENIYIFRFWRRFFPSPKSNVSPWQGLVPQPLTCKPWPTIASMPPRDGAWSLARTAPLEVQGPGQWPPGQPGAFFWPVLESLSHRPLCRAQLLEPSLSRAGTMNMMALVQLTLSGSESGTFQTGKCKSLCPGMFCQAALLVWNKVGVQSSVKQLKEFEDRIFSFQGEDPGCKQRS